MEELFYSDSELDICFNLFTELLTNDKIEYFYFRKSRDLKPIEKQKDIWD